MTIGDVLAKAADWIATGRSLFLSFLSLAYASFLPILCASFWVLAALFVKFPEDFTMWNIEHAKMAEAFFDEKSFAVFALPVILTVDVVIDLLLEREDEEARFRWRTITYLAGLAGYSFLTSMGLSVAQVAKSEDADGEVITVCTGVCGGGAGDGQLLPAFWLCMALLLLIRTVSFFKPIHHDRP